jgi:hypothetical protein
MSTPPKTVPVTAHIRINERALKIQQDKMTKQLAKELERVLAEEVRDINFQLTGGLAL